jgi:hypothetical protein
MMVRAATAPCCTIDEAMTGRVFLTSIERNVIVMIDNLPARKAAGVGEIV